MDSFSISDIVWNLNSGFGGMSFKDAELILINREQRLKTEILEIEEKYNIVLKENEALKKKCDWYRNESKEDTRLRRELRDDLRVKESEVFRARTKIRFLEMDEATACRKADESERRKEDAIQENARLLLKISSLEEEKAEAQREIEKHLQKIGCLEKEKEDAVSAAHNLNDIFNSFKGRIVSLMQDSSLKLTAHDGELHSLPKTTPESQILRTDDTYVENRLITKIKEEPDLQCSCSPLKLSGQNVDPSLNRLKRKRDSSGSSSSRVLDTSNDNNSMLAVPSWQFEFEADMLSAIETDPIVAMEAVCALYRQHKCHVNRSPALAFRENRGFDRLHVLRGTDLAEFLLNGDPEGDMKKSPEELQLHDPKGLDDCKRIATTNSRQLFEIYRRQDDPFFGPK